MMRCRLILFLTLVLSLFISPCIHAEYKDSLEAALASEYPLPLAMSADGAHLLLRTVDNDEHFSLEVLNLTTKTLQKMPRLDGEAMRALWSPSGLKISFYFQPRNKALRQLCIWDLASNIIIPMPAESYAEPVVLWSSDSANILSINEQGGVLVTDIAAHRSTVITRQRVRAAAFTSSSHAISFVPASSPYTMVVANVRSSITHSFVVHQASGLNDIEWQPNGKLCLLD